MNRPFFAVFLSIFIFVNGHSHHREKRFLLFPRGNPTRQQFIAGIGLPLDLEQEALTIGYVFKAQYFLPYNVTHLYPTRFEKRDVENFEDDLEYSGDHSDESFVDGTRWTFYHFLDLILREKMKTDGKQCIMQYICEVSKLPFDVKGGIFSELLQILFSPSTTSAEMNDFSYAEHLGRKRADCKTAFKKCSVTLIDLLSKLD